MLKSFDTPVKRRVRAEYRSFLKETVLRHKKPEEVKVLCLPGHEAVEIFDVYDRLGIPRSNIYAAEWNGEAFERLEALKLGIHAWKGDVFEYLGYAGMKRITGENKEIAILLQKGDLELKKRPLRLVEFEERGEQYFVEASLQGIPEDDAEIPKEWRSQSFDIIALDICGHITATVVNGLSALFRGGLLQDRGVLTLTSLAMREHPLTRMLIQMAIMMDALVRGTIWRVALEADHAQLEKARKSFELAKEAWKRPEIPLSAFGSFRERTGIEVLVILLGFGNELFTELLTMYKTTMEGKLLVDMPQNNIFEKIMETETDETAMIVRNVKRYSYRSGPSQMRTAFLQFRKSAKAIRETGNLMEVVFYLGLLGAPIVKIETPIEQPVKARILEKIRQGDYRVEA